MIWDVYVSPAEMADAQADAESLMQDTFTAYSPAITKVGGLETEAWATEYDTPGKVAGRSSQTSDTVIRTVTVGGVERDVLDGGLHLPIGSPTPSIGWEFECIAVGPASDPALLGRRWHVVSVPSKSYATARRLDVIELSQG